MTQDVVDLVGLERKVHRDQDGPQSRDRESERHERVGVAGEYRHPVAVPNALPRQAVCQLVADSIEVGVAPYDVVAQNRRLFRKPVGRAAKQITKRLATNRIGHRAPIVVAELPVSRRTARSGQYLAHIDDDEPEHLGQHQSEGQWHHDEHGKQRPVGGPNLHLTPADKGL